MAGATLLRYPVAMDALDRIDQATRRYRRTERAHTEARDELQATVLNALRDGVPATAVADHSPYTAAWVRKLARDNGIAPPPGYEDRGR